MARADLDKGLLRVVPIALVVVASAWFAFAALWGIFGLNGAGHLGGGSTGTAMAAEQMVKWHIWYPAGDWYSGLPPPKTEYNCHHPFGVYWATALFLAVFGHRDFVVHAAPALMSAFMPWLLYAIAKQAWGRAVGAVCACAFAVVPIAIGFSAYNNLEVMTMFGAALFFLGHARHQASPRFRNLILSAVGLLVAVSADWVGYLIAGPLLAWSLVRAFLVPRRVTPPFRFEPYARWWAVSVALAVASLMLWVALFAKVDRLSDWLASADARGGGLDLPLREVLKQRASWIEFSFTPIAIFIGKIGLPIALLRVLVRRRDEEIYSIAVFLASVVQYVGFRRGADVHIFWPQYFAMYYALLLAQLAATVRDTVAWGARRMRVLGTGRVAVWCGLVAGLLPTLAMSGDAVRSLWIWRRTGGRYNEHGGIIRSHLELFTVLHRVVMPSMPPNGELDVHPSIEWTWEHAWTYAGRPVQTSTPAPRQGFWLTRASAMGPDEQKRVAGLGHVRIYGDIWVVDEREPVAALDAFSLQERQPNVFEWLLLGGVEPVREPASRPDPFLTWEWRVHLGQPATAPPVVDSGSIDDLRIAFDVAVSEGDSASAERLREIIERQLDRSVETAFDQGIRLVGVRLRGGVQPTIETWFEAAGPTAGDAWFDVRSVVEARDPSSSIPPDTTERHMTYPPSIPTKLWRPGFLYHIDAIANHRIGLERYYGIWQSRDHAPPPSRRDGRPFTNLAVLR